MTILEKIKARLARLVACGALTPEAAEYMEGAVIGRLWHTRLLMGEDSTYKMLEDK